MEEKDLVKASAEGLMKPIADLIEKLAGPAAEEIGLSVRDSVRVWRARRQLKLLQRVKRMLDDAGISPSAVHLKILLPAMDYASLEDDDDLQTVWAALLANAANAEAAMNITTAFPEILRQLSKAEAVFLSTVYDKVLESDRPESRAPWMVEQIDFGTWHDLMMLLRMQALRGLRV